jgi:hypothetical protein
MSDQEERLALIQWKIFKANQLRKKVRTILSEPQRHPYAETLRMVPVTTPMAVSVEYEGVIVASATLTATVELYPHTFENTLKVTFDKDEFDAWVPTSVIQPGDEVKIRITSTKTIPTLSNDPEGGGDGAATTLDLGFDVAASGQVTFTRGKGRIVLDGDMVYGARISGDHPSFELPDPSRITLA